MRKNRFSRNYLNSRGSEREKLTHNTKDFIRWYFAWKNIIVLHLQFLVAYTTWQIYICEIMLQITQVSWGVFFDHKWYTFPKGCFSNIKMFQNDIFPSFSFFYYNAWHTHPANKTFRITFTVPVLEPATYWLVKSVRYPLSHPTGW